MSFFRQHMKISTVPLVRSIALRFPSGHRIETHEHEWAQVVYAAKGVMAVRAKSKQWVVPPLRCLWVPRGVGHSVEMVGEVWMRTVYVRNDLDTELWNNTRVLDVTPLLRELLLETVRIGMLNQQDVNEQSLARVLLTQLVRSREVGLALPLPTDPRARSVAERAGRLLEENTPLSVLCRGVGASPRTIERLFEKETGMTFGRWRQQACVQHAVRRLAERVSVTTVAFECGYTSVSAFVTMFKRTLGTTPGRYMGTEDDG